jgi:hypothetical protein
VDQRRCPLGCLDQVGHDGLIQQHHHCARRPQVLGAHGLTVHVRSNHDIAQPLAQVRAVTRQRQDCHNLARRRDHKPGLSRDAVHFAAQTHDHVAQRPVVHVQCPRPRDVVHVQAQLVAVVQVCINHRREQVVRRCHGVEVLEMEVDYPTWNHFCDCPPPVAPPFSPNTGPSDGSRSVTTALAELLWTLRQAYRDDRLAFRWPLVS